MAALGKTEADMEAMRKRAPKGVAAGLIGSLIAAFVLAILLEYGRSANVGLPGGAAGGLVVGFRVWFGFLLTTTGAGPIFEGRPRKLVGINLGRPLPRYPIMGLILGLWVGSRTEARIRELAAR